MKVQINEETRMASVILPPGTVIKINGIPLKLVSEATVETHKGNVPLITRPFGRDDVPPVDGSMDPDMGCDDYNSDGDS